MLAAALLYVSLDFFVDIKPSSIHSSYQFRLPALVVDEPIILRQDNLAVVVIRRSPETIERLHRNLAELQDPESKRSRQPDYASDLLRAGDSEYFVALAIGTDLGCGLVAEAGLLREICGDARYDFAGRALGGQREFRNLTIPDYNFSDNFSSLNLQF